jgi:glycosyltransferase involved in cell wall biosynthesis
VPVYRKSNKNYTLKIAVNTRFLFDNYLEGYGNFINETLKRITVQHPEHEFLFIFDRPFDPRFIYGDNVKGVVCRPAARHPLLWKLWYDIKLPAVLKKNKVDVLLSPDAFCSLRTSVPQCLVVHDLAFLHYPSFNRRSHLIFYKRYTGKFLKKAASVATVSEFSKNDILQHYRLPAGKIDVVYSGVKEIFQPIGPEEKEQVKLKYCGGKEYFLYTGAIHPRKNLIHLLKAFSLFKKRQHSSMKLVLTGRLAWKYEGFLKDLQSYKYKDDVVLTGYVEEQELVGITAAAYAMVYPSLHEGFGVPVLEAMRSSVPVITSANSAMQEIAGEAALYADPSDPHAIASQMMLIYKDEALRKLLIQKGHDVQTNYNWDRTAGLLWKSILKALG